MGSVLGEFGRKILKIGRVISEKRFCSAKSGFWRQFKFRRSPKMEFWPVVGWKKGGKEGKSKALALGDTW